MYLSAPGIICNIGNQHEEILRNVQRATSSLLTDYTAIDGSVRLVGRVNSPLQTIPQEFDQYNSRNARLAYTCLQQIMPEVDTVMRRYGKQRVAIVLGSSTSGIAEGEQALKNHYQDKPFPKDYHYSQQEIGATSNFLARLLGINHIHFTVSTACSSGAKAIACAARLIRLNLCDAVIVGGVDSLCDMTIAGFGSLESLATGTCNPFSENRDGINIGEAATLFVMTRHEQVLRLAGAGETSDAYHISAPRPDGQGAITAMKQALATANLAPEMVDYVNLHGTATPKNDAMEAEAIFQVLKDKVYCSSTKPFTGHTLGAAGALELGLCALTMLPCNKSGALPVHCYDGQYDSEIRAINLVNPGTVKNVRYAMSNSFAFGGSNISLIVENNDH